MWYSCSTNSSDQFTNRFLQKVYDTLQYRPYHYYQHYQRTKYRLDYFDILQQNKLQVLCFCIMIVLSEWNKPCFLEINAFRGHHRTQRSSVRYFTNRAVLVEPLREVHFRMLLLWGWANCTCTFNTRYIHTYYLYFTQYIHTYYTSHALNLHWAVETSVSGSLLVVGTILVFFWGGRRMQNLQSSRKGKLRIWGLRRTKNQSL